MAARVLICDDQAIVCEGLRGILKTAPGIEVVGVAHNGAQALDLIPQVQPDLVLMDLKMPVMNGVQATRAIREQFPEVRVLVLTTYNADDWVLEAVRAGAQGYLLKDTPREGLLAAIEGTLQGKTHIDAEVAGSLLQHVALSAPPAAPGLLDALSEREMDVLRLLAEGAANATIADRLALSEGTVRNYVSIILSKLGVRDRTQAALLAQRSGLLNNKP